MFPAEQFSGNERETAMLIKEKIIQRFVDTELATREDFKNPRTELGLIKYPIDPKLIRI